MTAVSRRCVVHDCPEDPVAGRCYDWLNDPAVPSEPVCDFGPPQRIRLSRQRGWRLPSGCRSVARPGRFGNPFRVADCIEAGFATDEEHARRVCVDAFRDWLHGNRWADGSGPEADKRRDEYLAALPELAGLSLACWCPITDADGNRVPCHADVILEYLAATA